MTDIIKRYIETHIEKDISRKMVFLAGPRQSGKTTFGKYLLEKTGVSIEKRYMNWDAATDREEIIQKRGRFCSYGRK